MNSVIRQSKLKKRHTRMRQLFLRASIFLCIISACLSLLLFSPYMRAQRITIDGATALPQASIEGVVRNMFSEKIYGFIPKDNVFFLDEEYMQKNVLESFPELASANVEHSFRKGLHIEVTDRVRWALYCRNKELEETTSSCFFIDEHGIAYAEAPRLTGDILLRINDKKNKTEILRRGTSVLEEDAILGIRNFLKRLEERLDVKAYEVVLGGEYPSHIVFTTEEGWHVIAELATPAETALEDLAIVLEKQVKDRTKLDYVDIRFPGKVFYKMRGS